MDHLASGNYLDSIEKAITIVDANLDLVSDQDVQHLLN